MDTKLLDILACPMCKGGLHFDRENHVLVCLFDRLAYPIRDEIPVMLVDEAKKLTLDEVEAYR